MIKSAIFDMDGTLVNSASVHKSIEKDFFKQFGLELSDDDHKPYAGMTMPAFYGEFKRKFDLPGEVDDYVLNHRRSFFKYLNSGKMIHLMPGVVDLLDSLIDRGTFVALATSASRDVMDRVLDVFDLDKYFPVKFCGDDVIHGKPDPEIFLKASNELGVEPVDCVVFEDAFNGVKAAKDAGMKCIGYTFFGKNIQDLSQADLVIDDYKKLSVDDLLNL